MNNEQLVIPVASSSNEVINSDNSSSFKSKAKRVINTKSIVRIALCAATVTASRQAMSWYPNVEFGTLLLVVYTITFGMATGFATTIVYTLVEMAIYGPQWWFITQFVYWPLLAICLGLIANKKYNYIWGIVLGIIFTCGFAALSTLTTALLYRTDGVSFTTYYAANYIAGLTQAGIHIGSNVVILILLVYPLYKLCKKNYKLENLDAVILENDAIDNSSMTVDPEVVNESKAIDMVVNN